MGRRTSLVQLNQISDINMTPLMDLTFILLITFIITFPLIEQGVSIELPKGEAGELPEGVSRSISLNGGGQLFLDDVPVSRDELASALVESALSSPDSTVFVRADAALPYGEVMELMRMLHAANITRMALVTEADSL
ncbi:MAG: biopolymer transporter ExbD [Kiritimatiellaceae bacterium]|nr:MAG: biopolymer transporter ExbD [Kiritimatiellaceae bacterium]